MFPHKITIFNVLQNENGINYHRCLVNDVYHYETQSINQEGHGEKITSVYNVCFSKKALEKYVNEINDKSSINVFTLKNNDIIVYGEFDEIKSITDIQHSNSKYFLIKSISDNRVDSDVDNILVTG